MKQSQNLGNRHAYRFYIIKLRKSWREDNERALAKQSDYTVKHGNDFTTHGQRSDNLTKQRDTKTTVKEVPKTTVKVKPKTTSKKKSSGRRKSNSKKGMTYSQKKRASFNYRNEYFKKNPGIYGNIWFCSQCGKILIGKKNVVIDHIVPLNSIAGVNRTFNTVAICQKCNSSKSDRVDYRVVKGYLAKIFEVFTSHLPDALALVLSLIVSLAYQILNLLFILMTMPFTLANGKFLTYAVVIVIIFAFICSRL